MWIYIVLCVVIAIITIYKITTRKARSLVKNVSGKLKIKPFLVDNMLKAMGVERCNIYIDHYWSPVPVDDDNNEDVYTFIVFQVLRNTRPENIKWWKNRLEENGISSQMSKRDVEIALLYLRGLVGFELSSSDILNLYNEVC